VPKEQAEAAFKAIAAPAVAGFDPEPYLVATRAALEKRGRVLSQANQERISRARDGAEACMSALDEVMSSMPMEPEEMPKAAPVVYVSPQPKYLVDPQAVASAVSAAVSRSVRESVNRLSGRID
jgi:hypothetical protein